MELVKKFGKFVVVSDGLYSCRVFDMDEYEKIKDEITEQVGDLDKKATVTNVGGTGDVSFGYDAGQQVTNVGGGSWTTSTGYYSLSGTTTTVTTRSHSSMFDWDGYAYYDGISRTTQSTGEDETETIEQT